MLNTGGGSRLNLIAVAADTGDMRIREKHENASYSFPSLDLYCSSFFQPETANCVDAAMRSDYGLIGFTTAGLIKLSSLMREKEPKQSRVENGLECVCLGRLRGECSMSGA